MENETFNVKIYFVVPSKYENNDECSAEMYEAFQKCDECGLHPTWINEAKAYKLKDMNKQDVFVLESFEGNIFNKLQNSKCVTVGPRCLLSCFVTGDPIPDGTSPIYNTAMRNLMVSASGFSNSVKADIERKVNYMGGIFTKQLRQSVTHLVTDNVWSAKYERAVELKLTIVKLDWIYSVWDTNLKDAVPATDKLFFKYKCPPFYNLIITSTNLNKKQKDDVKRLVNSNGGEFMGVLDGEKVKIVIAQETNAPTEKLKFAMQNNIPCLKIEWIYDSVEAGYSLPFSNYVIKSTKACSTPEKLVPNETMDFSAISIIPGDQKGFVDETVASASMMSVASSTSSIRSDTAPNLINNLIDRLSVNEAKKAGPFLDGCNVYLAGFRSNQRDKLNRILSIGSATRFDEISDSLTHVLIGDPFKAANDLRAIKSRGICPYVVKLEWLEESIKQKSPVSEDVFICEAGCTDQRTEPPSPLSQKNLKMLQRPKIPLAPLFDEEDKRRAPDKKVLDHTTPDIVQQYLQKSVVPPSAAEVSLRNSLKLPESSKFENHFEESSNKTTNEDNSTKNGIYRNLSVTDRRDDSAVPMSQDTALSQKLFEGLCFIVKGFDGEEFQHVLAQIQGLGGKLVSSKYCGTPDYGVVPIFGAEFKRNIKQLVTNLFIEDCIDNEQLVDLKYYHNPIVLKSDRKPLSNLVMGMSTYSGCERMFLSKLSEALGARYQDTFARKTNIEKNTYSSTHLICPTPEGNKYNAAVKWKLPAVTCDWLLECYETMTLVDETKFLIGETMAPEKPKNSNEKMPESVDSGKPISPRLTAQTPLTETQTPIINKRLNLDSAKTPYSQSPFHISTPDSPYGQIFKDNPSPRTRKGWLKWINNFPDLSEQEPPVKRRKSTPFSDVKRNAWDIITGRVNPDDTSSKKESHNGDECGLKDDVLVSGKSTALSRKLSFSEENSSNVVATAGSGINLQIAQLDNLLQKACTPEPRQSLSGEQANRIQLEADQPPLRCLAKETQQESVGWEDPIQRAPPPRQLILNALNAKESIKNETLLEEEDGDASNQSNQQIKPKFMFSGIKDKASAEKTIYELGGEVSTEAAFDTTATHLIVVKLSRNEKILSSIAAGKWVLHYNYIQACEKENRFINEEQYECGNPKSKGIIPDPSNDSELTIMKAAYRWRLKLMKSPGGAFNGMVAILMTHKDKRDQFERLIKAGGGKVVHYNSSYETSALDSNVSAKITHCFVQPKQCEQQIEWAKMANKGIMCFSPQYLNECLMAENPLNEKENVVPEFKKYLTTMFRGQ